MAQGSAVTRVYLHPDNGRQAFVQEEHHCSTRLIPREEMADLRQSSFVTTEKDLVLMILRLSPSIVTRQRKPSTNVTVNSWLRLLLETKLFSLGTFHVKY